MNRLPPVMTMEIRSRSQAREHLKKPGTTLENDVTEMNEHPCRIDVASITILLVDDHALMREGLRQLLSLEDDLKVLDEAVNGLEAIHKIHQLQPDVVLMDISMPVIDGIAVTRQITQEFPEIFVIMLTMHHQDQQVLQAIKCGAHGYLLKTASSQELAQTIRQVHAGQMLIGPEMTGTIVSEFRRLSNLSDGDSPHYNLSEKELDILHYIALGMNNSEIAEQLAYSEKTVKNYLSVIFQKLGIRDRTQAAVFAFRHGLVPLEDLSSL